MNEDTYISIKQLNDQNVLFIIGDSPTVTFNENVTVYTYPKVNYNESNISNDETITNEKNIVNKILKKLISKWK